MTRARLPVEMSICVFIAALTLLVFNIFYFVTSPVDRPTVIQWWEEGGTAPGSAADSAGTDTVTTASIASADTKAGRTATYPADGPKPIEDEVGQPSQVEHLSFLQASEVKADRQKVYRKFRLDRAANDIELLFEKEERLLRAIIRDKNVENLRLYVLAKKNRDDDRLGAGTVAPRAVQSREVATITTKEIFLNIVIPAIIAVMALFNGFVSQIFIDRMARAKAG